MTSKHVLLKGYVISLLDAVCNGAGMKWAGCGGCEGLRMKWAGCGGCEVRFMAIHNSM